MPRVSGHMARHLRQQALLCGAALAAVLVGLAGVAMLRNAAVAEDRMVEAPIFEVDPLWPKPLPEEGLLGMTIGISIDAQDNVWIVRRGSSTLNNNEKGAELNPPISICCRSAPPVIAFNPAGDVIHARGRPGQGYEWPESMHGVFVDHQNNVWLGGNGAKDAQILKFTVDASSSCSPATRARTPAATTPKTSAASPRSTSIRRPMKASSPTATATGAWW
jgi:hypothetical protein